MEEGGSGVSVKATRSSGALEWVLLGGLYAFTLAAIVGYGLFALHPERLPDSDFARRIFTLSFGLFARLHIVIAATVLIAVLLRRLRLRWFAAFAAVSTLAFLAEHVGTGYGIPFGGYGYSGLLGAKLGGRVPALIPVSWFLMALPAWILARTALPSPAARLGRISLGALWLVAWDLALDPAMSFLTPYWSWVETGPYYGMPWLNLVGWFGTGLLLVGTIEAFAERAGWDALSPRWIAAYYAAILLMPLGMLAAAGAWAAVAATVAAVGGLGLASLALGARLQVARPARGLPIGTVRA